MAVEVTVGMLQAFADAWNRHDAEALMSFMSDDCVFEASAGPEVSGTRYVGRDAVKTGYLEVFASFPDAHWGNARHFVQGDRGVSEWTFTGTRADGSRVEVNGCDLFTFRDGKIAIKNSYRKNRPPVATRVPGIERREAQVYAPPLSTGGDVMPANTVRLHRVLRAPPERVYRAFLDADALAKWLPPHGFTARIHHLDARVGGTYRMSFTHFATGATHSFGGEYLELVPHERIRHTDRFDDPNLPGTLQVTVTLTKVSCGTELDIVQEGIPEAIPLEACHLGWQDSLALLTTLVEAGTPG